MVIHHGERAQLEEVNTCDYGLQIDRGILFGEYRAQIKMYMDIEMEAEHLFL